MKRPVIVAVLLLAVAGVVQIGLTVSTEPVGASLEIAIVVGVVLAAALGARLVPAQVLGVVHAHARCARLRRA